jgi:hypothetical protein
MVGRQPGRPRSNPNVAPTPNDSQLIQQMAQAMTQMMEAQGREDHYQSFRRHDLPTFSGGRDPMVLEEWLD